MRRVKYQSLSDEVREEILKYIRTSFTGEDTKLPTEEQFAKMLGASRITIRTALNDLANEGIIFRRQGKGTFVNHEAIGMKVHFTSVPLIKEMIARYGYTPTVRVQKSMRVQADEKLADRLQLPLGSDLVQVNKVFFADREPCAYCEDYFALSILKNEEDAALYEQYQDSLFAFFEERCHRRILWDGTEIFTTTNHDEPHLSAAFACEGQIKSFLLLESVNYDVNDVPVFFAKEYIDTSYIRFNSIRRKLF